jgi:hypothetical protein
MTTWTCMGTRYEMFEEARKFNLIALPFKFSIGLFWEYHTAYTKCTLHTDSGVYYQKRDRNI